MLLSLSSSLSLPFAVSTFCGKDFISLGRHLWRCKSKLNPENVLIRVNSSLINLVTPESMRVITNGNKEMTRTSGKHCKGLTGLKAHQRFCRIIQGLSENLMKDLDKNSGGDVDESTFGDLGDNNCMLSSSVFFDCDNERMKKGVQLPKSPQHWAIADDFFKATFLNIPIG